MRRAEKFALCKLPCDWSESVSGRRQPHFSNIKRTEQQWICLKLAEVGKVHKTCSTHHVFHIKICASLFLWSFAIIVFSTPG